MTNLRYRASAMVLALTLCAVIVIDAPTARADSGARDSTSPSFRHDIIPLLTRLGCNQGACHGKNAGRNGFKLSLRGYAPEMDQERLLKESRGRRIVFTAPDLSLLLTKPTGRVPHGGGRLLDEDSRAYHTLVAWIAAGAPGLDKSEPLLDKLIIAPRDQSMRVGQTLQLKAVARLADGSERDVTWLAQFFSNDPGVVTVTPDGLATCIRPGETAVRVHFQDRVQVVNITIPYDRAVEASWFASRNNTIDEHVFDKLAALRVQPSALCDDATFIRRAFLDTIGTLPTPAEVTSFLADQRSDKRARLVDDLLQRPQFVDYWAMLLGDLLQNRKERDHDVRGSKGVRSFHQWLRQQLAADRPWNQIATDVLTATGDAVADPQIGYFITTVGEQQNADQSEAVASVAQAFLGTRIGCAKCHNHPLERYTQDDYYHFAAFFARMSLSREKPDKAATTLQSITRDEFNHRKRITETERKIDELKKQAEGKSPEEANDLTKKIEEQKKQLESLNKQLAEMQTRPIQVSQPRTGQRLAPQPLDRSPTEIKPGDDPRVALAKWMTDPSNEYFAGAMINRLWKHYLGVGLVEPVDDLRASNPPTNPALWKYLCDEFVGHHYDLKHVMRIILNSRTYQLSSTTLATNETDDRFYSHYYARRLQAEVLLDAVSDATGVPDQFDGYPVGLRAVQLPDPSVQSYFLSLFGRSDRVTACACERQGEVTLPQLLHMQNGDDLTRKLHASDGRLAEWVKNDSDNAAVTDAIFLSTLSRRPTDHERTTINAMLAADGDRLAVFRDVMWALINTTEFGFNH